jgi:DNA processing protein
VGPATYRRLLAEHGSAAAALDALPQIAAAAGVRDYETCSPEVAGAELARGQKLGARLLLLGAPDYPARLAEIADAPPVLWAMGVPGLAARPVVALIGARNASSLGLRMARALAGALSEAGVVVASGLARGIDTAAHRASLDGGTIAVEAGGLGEIYPPENTDLAGAIVAAGGLRLSECPPGTRPLARHFPARNRIISGLSLGVVVIEAAARSGSLISARDALDQGREVMAVPGHPFDARAAGCNALIREGATLVRDAADVLAATAGIDRTAAARTPTARAAVSSPFPPAVAAPQTPGPDGLRADILACLGPSPIAEDQLIRDLARPAAQIAPELLLLELDGRIVRHRGGLLARVD